MLKKLTILFVLATTSVIYLPSQAAAYSPGEKTNSIAGLSTENTVLSQRRGRGYNRRRSGRWYGYRNYGQWRRTQNRRGRYVTRTYWRNGRRYTRIVRIY